MVHKLDDLNAINQFCHIPAIANWLTMSPANQPLDDFESCVMEKVREESYGSIPKYHFKNDSNHKADNSNQSVLRRIMSMHKKRGANYAILTYSVNINNVNKEILCVMDGDFVHECAFCVYDASIKNYVVMTLPMSVITKNLKKLLMHNKK